jgi:hypothetical protein
MRRAIYALMGALVVVSCLVPEYEVDDSADGGSDGPGGESGTTTGGSSNGGNAGQGGSTTGGAGRGGNTTGGAGRGGNTTGGNTTGGNTTGGDAGESGNPSGGDTNGGSTNGGSAGAGMGGSGGAGMSGAGMSGSGGAGMGGSGGGCSMGLSVCDGECFNLQTDGEHCGDCDTDCATGEVCLAGDCELDCGTLTQCGTSCVNTATDEMHCGRCDTSCLGTCVGGNCDLSCPNNGLRCGANCCAAAPTNGTVQCQSNQCVYGCATNFNDCNPSPTVTECYSRTDVAHCGTQCLDCRQPNATPGCTTGGACSNTCIGEALPCAPVNGKPGCGTWDFESGTTEGWSVWDSDPVNVPTAADSALTTRTQRVTSGNRSLAVHFNGNGTNRFGIQFKLRVCESGQAVDLKRKLLTMDVMTETDSGTLPFTIADGHNYFLVYNGTTSLIGTGDFDMASDDIPIVADLNIFSDVPALTDIVFWFRVFTPWRGWVYIDNVRLQDCNPEYCP